LCLSSSAIELEWFFSWDWLFVAFPPPEGGGRSMFGEQFFQLRQ
jgi:hypothetical protein